MTVLRGGPSQADPPVTGTGRIPPFRAPGGLRPAVAAVGQQPAIFGHTPAASERLLGPGRSRRCAERSEAHLSRSMRCVSLIGSTRSPARRDRPTGRIQLPPFANGSSRPISSGRAWRMNDRFTFRCPHSQTLGHFGARFRAHSHWAQTTLSRIGATVGLIAIQYSVGPNQCNTPSTTQQW